MESSHSPFRLQPIVLHFQEKCQGKKLRPYRLNTWSLEHAEVFKIIEEEWKHIHTGSSSHVLQRKLQNTMRRIRSWCLEYTKKNKIDWKAISNNLIEHQQSITSINQVDQDLEVRNNTLNDLKEKTTYWKQRAKSRWDALGDLISAFFYESVKGRSLRNVIKAAIKDQEGTWFLDQSSI